MPYILTLGEIKIAMWEPGQFITYLKRTSSGVFTICISNSSIEK